ncbi:MAG TPA: Cof-type HAD-IIB family hydrolase [Bacilli bacterium]
MAYKMIAIDIDDTLLNDELAIPPETRQALAKAKARGVEVTLATGRMFASAKQIAARLELNVPIITYQGALVKTVPDEETLYFRPVPEAIAREVFAWVQKHGLHLQVYCDDVLYTREHNEKVTAYARQSNIPFVVEPDFARLLKLPITKMLMIDEPATLDRLKPDLERLLGASAHVTKSKPNYLEVMHPEGTKGSALSFLARHFGCAMEQVIAIGDSWNDRDMIEAAGLGVAMANAVPQLKQIADYVTLSNNEQGVKHVIETFILAE